MAAYHALERCNVPGVRLLFGQFVGATGASPTASTVKGLGISSVTRSNTGLWSVTLTDSQADFGTVVHVEAAVVNALNGATMYTATVHVDTSGSTPVIQIQTRANSALDDVNGLLVTFAIHTTNSLGSGII